MKILAIDPGNENSAYVVFDTETKLPISFGIVKNNLMLEYLRDVSNRFGANYLAIEMIASYGMPVGKTVFDTCVWIGMFAEAFNSNYRTFIKTTYDFKLVYRTDVKMFLCHTLKKVNDSIIRQAIMDLYGSTRQKAIGTKKKPGPLYGMSKDVWAAMGVALTAASLIKAGA